MNSLTLPQNSHPLAIQYVTNMYEDMISTNTYNQNYDLSLYILCQTLSVFFTASDQLGTDILIPSRFGEDDMKVNPLLGIIHQSRNTALNIIQSFGGTQAASTRLKSKSAQNQETQNVLNKILFSGNEEDDE